MTDTDTKTIHEWLSKLVGLNLSVPGRVADMRVFTFGRTIERGKEFVDEYALHIQCSWRIENADGIITGRSDLWEPIEQSAGFSYDFWDYHRDGNLQDLLIQQHFNYADELSVQTIDVGYNGTFSIDLSGGCRLVVFPSGSVGEDWRLFRPGSTEQEDHLEITGGALERG